MSKLKTNQAIAKRFILKKTKKGRKLLKRADGQDHFNARESGKTGRNKRRDVTMTKTLENTIVRAIPYA